MMCGCGFRAAGRASLIAIIPAEIAAADQLRLRLEPGLADDPAPPLGWSARSSWRRREPIAGRAGKARFSLPGLGRGDWNVTFVASLRHPDNQPLDATVSANGVPVARLPDGEPRQLSFLVPAALVPDGDLTLDDQLEDLPGSARAWHAAVRAARRAGRADRAAAAAEEPAVRADDRAGPVLLPAAHDQAPGDRSACWRWRWCWAAPGRWRRRATRPRLCCRGWPSWRSGAWLLLLALERLLPWGFAKAGVPLSPWLLRALLLVFFAGYWIKAGGMLYPYFIGIDHAQAAVLGAADLERPVLAVLWHRQPDECGDDAGSRSGATTSRSFPTRPGFTFLPARSHYLPLPTLLAAHMFSALVDTSRVFLLALLARKSRFSERETLFGALLIAVTPVDISAAFMGQPADHLRHLVDAGQHGLYCRGLPAARSALAVRHTHAAADNHAADVHRRGRVYGRVPVPAGAGALAD